MIENIFDELASILFRTVVLVVAFCVIVWALFIWAVLSLV